MFIQTVIQTLLRKRKKTARSQNPTSPTDEKELSPMAQRIMEKLAEHEKTVVLGTKRDNKTEDKGS